MTKQIGSITEMDAYGCHITIEKIRGNEFHVTVSYKIYNDLGVWVASPKWGNVGTGEQSYIFLMKTIARAVKHNSIILDIPALDN